MPQAVIFDIDGTLVDSVDLHARSWVDAFRHFGHDIPFDQVRSQIGKGSDQLLPALLGRDEADRNGEAINEFRGGVLKRDYLPQVTAFPAVRALFKKCVDAGLRVALASSGNPPEVEHNQSLLNVDDLLDARTDADDADRSKPHPDIFAAALNRLGDPPAAEVVAVGDTPYDAEAAGKLGIICVGVLCGGFPEADLRAAGCVAIYRDPADLLARFDASPLAG